MRWMVAAIVAMLWLQSVGAAEPTTRPVTRSTQFGAERLDFEVGKQKAFLIEPTRAAANGSRPWVWYAPAFIGALPSARHTWIMTRLLDSGFAIAGIDVGESYGNVEGRESYEALYKVLTTEFKLAPRACLLPQSRGGLMLYNWAAEHSDQVQCIGGIYPVCDLASYPGLERAAPAYNMTVEQLKAHLAEHNPIDRLKPLAAAHIPILHVHGDNDKIVPLPQNSALLIERYKSLGGPGELLTLPNKGHEEVDEFLQNQQLFDFFIQHGTAADAKK